MTRELIFSNSFEPQFAAFTTWKSLVASQGGLRQTLAPSDFPGFEIIPGQVKYLHFDTSGHPVSGVQSFAIRVHFAHAQLAVSTLRSLHSAQVALIEAFFAGGYIVPLPVIGDAARIDSVQLLSIDPATLSKTATHSSITAHAEYTFTIF